MIKSYPKIFHIGDKYINNIFNGNVVIEEKVDGSQFSFLVKNGELFCRSKNKQLVIDYPDKMFEEAVNYLLTVKDAIPENIIFYCEYLRKPKHNVLSYDRIPKNHLMLFSAYNIEQEMFINPMHLSMLANDIGIERIPELYVGKIDNIDELFQMLERKSVLGGQLIEGVVVKVYGVPVVVGTQIYDAMFGKFVSEKFKEQHKSNWKKDNTSKGSLENLIQSYKTEARWRKAIIHLDEKGEIEGSPKDIGALMKEIHLDFESEEEEHIKDALWAIYVKDFKKELTRGFPQWYKEYLINENTQFM